MRILVSNDDGIDAAGLRSLVAALSELPGAEIYVCAPDSQRSAAAHSISTGSAIMIEEREVPGAVWARALSGTPVDCVKFGIRSLRAEGIEMDLVFSGINHGSNIGTDVLYSGTVGAAAEAILLGVPGVAVSIDKSRPSAEALSSCGHLAKEICQKALSDMDEKTLLNVNFPAIPPEEWKGLRVTTLGPREYAEKFEVLTNPREQKYFWYSGALKSPEGLADELDAKADQDGYVSVTPLKLELTDTSRLDQVKSWDLKIK